MAEWQLRLIVDQVPSGCGGSSPSAWTIFEEYWKVMWWFRGHDIT